MQTININDFLNFISNKFEERKQEIMESYLDNDYYTNPVDIITKIHNQDLAYVNFIENINKEKINDLFLKINERIDLFMEKIDSFDFIKKHNELRHTYIVFSSSHNLEISLNYSDRKKRFDYSRLDIKLYDHSVSGPSNGELSILNFFDFQYTHTLFSELTKQFLDLKFIVSDEKEKLDLFEYINQDNSLVYFEKLFLSDFLGEKIYSLFSTDIYNHTVKDKLYNFLLNLHNEIINIVKYDDRLNMLKILFDNKINKNDFFNNLDLLKIQFDYNPVYSNIEIKKDNKSNIKNTI